MQDGARVRGHRRVVGRVSLDGNGLEGVRVVVGGREAVSDAEGNYAVLDPPAGPQRVALAARSGLPAGFAVADSPAVQVPEKTGHVTADLKVSPALKLPPLARPLPPSTKLQAGTQRLRVLPLPAVSRPIAEWASDAEPNDKLISGLEKLAATVMLDDDMRLLLVARSEAQPSAREAFRRAVRGMMDVGVTSGDE